MVRLCLILSSIGCGFFFSFTQHVGVTHLVFWFLPEEIIPFVAVDLVCPREEVSSGCS